MKKISNLFKKDSKIHGQEEKAQGKVDLSFLASLDLDESFEDAFPGEVPEEVRVYDIYGQEKND